MSKYLRNIVIVSILLPAFVRLFELSGLIAAIIVLATGNLQQALMIFSICWAVVLLYRAIPHIANAIALAIQVKEKMAHLEHRLQREG